MFPRPDDLTDEDEVIINSLVIGFTARQLAEELVRRCGCAFDHRLPGDAPPHHECGYHRGLREASETFKAATETLQKAAQRVMQVLGPEAVCECAGCAWETNEAIATLNDVGIVYQPRGPKLMQHNVEAERRGNETGST